MMSKINDLLIAKAEKYLFALMKEKLPGTIIFHDYDYALRVKGFAETIGEKTGFSEDEMNLLRIGALFLNAGYVNAYDNCIDESISIASAFLKDQHADEDVIGQVSELIKSAGLPQNPVDKIGEALCDAAMMYIATERGLEWFDLLYEETALGKPKYHKRSVFERGSVEFFTRHTYFTEFGKTVLQPGKEATVQRIAARLQRRKLIDSKKETTEKKRFEYSRGVDTMFRITARNQINLNSIADNKSNILISVNAIIISIIITMLAGNIGNMSQDIVPIIVFLVICLITI
ncbi:MAG: hypothetical protein MUC31_08160, partial [Bacteroidales bacterium]|nr:hypothetical protein [Bacteroidales bacterium]